MGGYMNFAKVDWNKTPEEMIKMLRAEDMRERRRILNTCTKKRLQQICKALNTSSHGNMVLLIHTILEKL